MAVSLTFVFRVAFPYRLERQRHYCGGGGGGTGKKLDRSALLRGDHCGYWTVLNPDGPATNAEFPTAVLVQARERRPNNSRYRRRQHGTPVQNTLTTTSWRGRARGRSLTLSHPPLTRPPPLFFSLSLSRHRHPDPPPSQSAPAGAQRSFSCALRRRFAGVVRASAYRRRPANEIVRLAHFSVGRRAIRRKVMHARWKNSATMIIF